MKQLVILGLSAGAIYLLYNAWKKQQDAEKKTETKPFVEEKPVEAPLVCPEGQLICETNPKKCFDPKIRYIVNPCKA